MGDIRERAHAQEAKPRIDDILAEIMIGYHFLSDQRGLALGMSGGIPLAIPITEMLAYCNVFCPVMNRKHFVRVVRAADNEFLKLQSETQKRKTKSKNGSNQKSGSVFPKL